MQKCELFQRSKKIINIVFKVAVVCVILNYIPIKVAIKTEKIKEQRYNYEFYVCESCVVTGAFYCASVDDNENLREPKYFFKLIGKSPENVLSDKLLINYEEMWSGNKFLVIGTSYSEYEITGQVNSVNDDYFYTQDWEIVYPVRRYSILGDLLGPKRFLNIYDFNWFKVIKSFFGKINI